MVSRHRKHVAVFPGAFKPPHRGHLEGIRYLLERPDIDEVTVFVSNRARLLPGTNLALDGATCCGLLRELVAGFRTSKPIYVMLTAHRATDAARDYALRLAPRRRVSLCIGETDHAKGDRRFDELLVHAPESLRLLRLPKLTPEPRASAIRAHMARSGSAAAHPDLVPEWLTGHDTKRYWEKLRASAQPMADIVQRKLEKSLCASGLLPYHSLTCLDGSARDPEFLLRGDAGAVYRLKYAGETTEPGSFLDAASPLPPRRLAAEYRAIKTLRCVTATAWRIPTVREWNKDKRLLLLEEPSGPALRQLLLQADKRTGQSLLRSAGAFLAQLHAVDLPRDNFWGSARADRLHWQELDTPGYANGRQGFVHLNFTPDVVHWDGERLWLSDFERAACYGDPRYDQASFTASLQAMGVEAGVSRAFLDGYRAHHGDAASVHPIVKGTSA